LGQLRRFCCPINADDVLGTHRLVFFHQQSFGRYQAKQPKLEYLRFVKSLLQGGDLDISHHCIVFMHGACWLSHLTSVARRGKAPQVTGK
jgi:hypothetical protein